MTTNPTDLLEIQHLGQCYADGVMQRDAEIWGNTWATDGEWHLAPGMDPVKGREELKTFWSGVMQGYPWVLHWVQPGIIEVTGDTATARGIPPRHVFMCKRTLRTLRERAFVSLASITTNWSGKTARGSSRCGASACCTADR